MFQFDESGYITPPEVHVLTLEEFERTFVIDLGRERLFRRLLDLVADLKNLGAMDFYLWVDGSYVTKKRIPRDIDVVAFFQESDRAFVSNHLNRLSEKYQYDLDIFFSIKFDEWRWERFWGLDRAGRKKGFIHINFTVA